MDQEIVNVGSHVGATTVLYCIEALYSFGIYLWNEADQP